MFLKGKKSSFAKGGRIRKPPVNPHGQVFSYYANRSVRSGATGRSTEEQQDALKRGPRFPWLKSLPRLAACLGGLLLIGMGLQLSNDVKVVTVGPKNGQVFLRDQQIYKDAAGTTFRTLLNSNKLTVDTAKISSDLKERFPELAVVSVSLPLLGSHPVVYIQPVVPKLILVGQGGMFVLDSYGRAVMPANQVRNLSALDVPVVNDQSGLHIEAGNVVLPRTAVLFITEVVDQLEAKGIKVASMTLPPGTNELHIRPEGLGYSVKYNLHNDAREGVGTYLAVKSRLEAGHKTPAEYVDVRVENRAYYR